MLSLIVSGVLALFSLAHSAAPPHPAVATAPSRPPVAAPSPPVSSASAGLAALIVLVAGAQALSLRD